ncbi:transglycosylase SLT domain-containing protein [Gordonia sp. Z-3]|uniref:Transglycosylase SLT domain-containing protein n=1 Tax=Gordonia tangerina TaxID=2911060 RepID=A0ABS9DRD8_9ACTN|nr:MULTISPECIES: transglycosylase SLT domain-containing protein [Gordonia]MCF3941184.1 transglycosylase SLT domain-containing protein [Gordonia tangerina]MED5803334.1 transglycosylase SLT domain-containing protein [Gordonia sp. Z-3]
MSVFTTSLRRVRGVSRARTSHVVGAATLAIAAAVTAGSIAVDEPARAEQPITQTAHTIDLGDNAETPAKSSTTTPAVAPAPAPVPAPAPAPKPAPKPVYPDNLDGWIRESLDIMRANNIPGSYDGIYRNIMRESTGNPQAINLYDSNAAAGIPSKGLLQVIDPTFAAYHVKGTAFDVWNPVSNIVAACNYAAHRYGSMDNVSSAY